MRKLLLFLFTITVLTVQAQEINWVTMDEALAAQQESPRKIVVDVYADWCGPCKMMDRNTFSNADVIEYINENYYAVKFDAEGDEVVNYQGQQFTNPGYVEGKRGRNATHEFSMALQVRGYPSMVYFDEQGELIQAIPGYQTPQQLEVFLKMIGSDDYKEVTSAESWQNYQKSFQGTFRK